MNVFEFDAAGWKERADIYSSINAAVNAPPGYGHGVNALFEAMIWDHANDPDFPPYIVRIRNLAGAPQDVRDELILLHGLLPEVLQEFRELKGRDFQVGFELS